MTDETTATDETTTGGAAADTKRKVMLLGGMAAALLLFGALYLVWARGRVNEDLADRNERAQQLVDDFEASQGPADEPNPTSAPLPESGPLLAPGEVMVVHRVPGEDYGRLAIRHIDGTRTLLDRTCMRVHIATDHGVCLAENEGVVASFTTTFFRAENLNADIKSYASALPSRARISPGGTFSAVTAFVSGSSYADIGAETTTIVTIDEIDSNQLLRGANQFTIASNEARFNNQNPQYWGVTFAADEDEVYITGFFGDMPEVMHGTLNNMTIEPTGWVGSCPSLSPDGETLVFKEMTADNNFELVAVNLETNTKHKLGETRPVDDQVEWLDNDTILYALHPEGGDTAVQPEFDIWMLDIAEGSEPELFLPNANSPAVAR
ncbi:MAG: hypothetical protein ACI9TF_000169 [Paracrocinitomix sp.]|jgi:hypothetical protein